MYEHTNVIYIDPSETGGKQVNKALSHVGLSDLKVMKTKENHTSYLTFGKLLVEAECMYVAFNEIIS